MTDMPVRQRVSTLSVNVKTLFIIQCHTPVTIIKTTYLLSVKSRHTQVFLLVKRCRPLQHLEAVNWKALSALLYCCSFSPSLKVGGAEHQGGTRSGSN